MAGEGAEIDRAAMEAAVEAVGRWWSEAPYFDAAEPHMDVQWRKLVLPFLRPGEAGIDWTAVVELGAGRGRTAAKLLPLASRLHLVDLHANNLEACRRRFGEDPRLSYHVTDGRSLPLPGESATFLFSFDSMVHFDSDVVRAYLRETRRVLRPGGHAFLHHSNTTAHPGGDFQAQPQWRNFMSAALLAHYALKEGLEVLRQKPVDWVGDGGFIDGFSLLRRPSAPPMRPAASVDLRRPGQIAEAARVHAEAGGGLDGDEHAQGEQERGGGHRP